MCLLIQLIMDQSLTGTSSTSSVIQTKSSTSSSNPQPQQLGGIPESLGILSSIVPETSSTASSSSPVVSRTQQQPSSIGIVPSGGGGIGGGLTPLTAQSPALSPPGKIFGRNYNGTMVVTSTPSNEAELQLYRVLQRASLLMYYDTLLEMGGDDVQQLCDAGEEEFLEIMALVGMASKPLHVRRLQKALQEWVNNPSAFQAPLPNVDISRTVYSPEPSGPSRSPFSSAIPSTYGTAASSSVVGSSTGTLSLSSLTTTLGSQMSSSTVQLTPSLTDSQISRLISAAERLSRQLPQLEPRAQSSKKRSSKELEQVMGMSENDPRRMDEIRKYAAIYGRFDCKRRPEKPLTLHEVCVNEAAAQICKFVPALLTRRDELFPLARQVVRDSGFGHSAGIARFAMSSQHQQLSRSSDEHEHGSMTKRSRLSGSLGGNGGDSNNDNGKELPESRDKIMSLYQRIGKTFDLSEASKFSYSYSRPEFEDTDSRFSFSNSSSPPLQGSNGGDGSQENMNLSDTITKNDSESKDEQTPLSPTSEPLCSSIVEGGPIGVQIISASGGHIIAVANPALALSPALGDTINVKREVISPDIR